MMRSLGYEFQYSEQMYSQLPMATDQIQVYDNLAGPQG